MPPKNPTTLPPAAQRNIEHIAKLEQRLLKRRSLMERAGESVARFFGSFVFIAAHVLAFTLYILANTGNIRGFKSFDPYPFPFLSLAVGIEFIFLTTFVLLNQNYQIRREEQWAHLHLQLSMLTEHEVTKSAQLLVAIARRLGLHGLASDKELSELVKPTSVTAFLQEIEKLRNEPIANPDPTDTGADRAKGDA